MTITAYDPPRDRLPEPAADNHVARWVQVLAPAAQLADRIANTEFVPGAMRGKPDVITAAILYGDEIGIGPMQALASIHVVDGRPAPSSELMRAMIFRAGHVMQVKTSTGEVCEMWGRRAGQSEATTITWTIEMARAAGLTDKAVWRKYPRALLLARCSSELARVLFPDVVKGLGHLTDDAVTVDDFDQWAATVSTEPAPKATGTTVKRRTRQTETRPLPEPEAPTYEPPSEAVDAPETVPEPVAGGDPPSRESVSPPVTTELPEPTQIPDPWDGKDPWAEPAAEWPKDPADQPPPAEPLPPTDDANPPDDNGPPGDRLHRAIFAGLNKIGAADDDALRHAIATAIVGRPITTFRNLTRRDALRMVGVLSELETGTLTLSIAPNGAVTIGRNAP